MIALLSSTRTHISPGPSARAPTSPVTPPWSAFRSSLRSPLSRRLRAPEIQGLPRWRAAQERTPSNSKIALRQLQ